MCVFTTCASIRLRREVLCWLREVHQSSDEDYNNNYNYTVVVETSDFNKKSYCRNLGYTVSIDKVIAIK